MAGALRAEAADPSFEARGESVTPATPIRESGKAIPNSDLPLLAFS